MFITQYAPQNSIPVIHFEQLHNISVLPLPNTRIANVKDTTLRTTSMQSEKYQVRDQIRPVAEWSLSRDGQVATEVARSSTSLRTCMLVASSIKLSNI